MSEEKILLSAKMAIISHSLINAHKNYLVDISIFSKTPDLSNFLIDYYWLTPFYDKGTLSNAVWRK